MGKTVFRGRIIIDFFVRAVRGGSDEGEYLHSTSSCDVVAEGSDDGEDQSRTATLHCYVAMVGGGRWAVPPPPPKTFRPKNAHQKYCVYWRIIYFSSWGMRTAENPIGRTGQYSRKRTFREISWERLVRFQWSCCRSIRLYSNSTSRKNGVDAARLSPLGGSQGETPISECCLPYRKVVS